MLALQKSGSLVSSSGRVLALESAPGCTIGQTPIVQLRQLAQAYPILRFVGKQLRYGGGYSLQQVMTDGGKGDRFEVDALFQPRSKDPL